MPSYVEGASLHQERGGATVIARYAFNELWSFVAGWAILLDYLILIALCAFATTDYLGGVLGAASSSGVAGVPARAPRSSLYVALVATCAAPAPRALRARRVRSCSATSCCSC